MSYNLEHATSLRFVNKPDSSTYSIVDLKRNEAPIEHRNFKTLDLTSKPRITAEKPRTRCYSKLHRYCSRITKKPNSNEHCFAQCITIKVSENVVVPSHSKTHYSGETALVLQESNNQAAQVSPKSVQVSRTQKKKTFQLSTKIKCVRPISSWGCPHPLLATLRM